MTMNVGKKITSLSTCLRYGCHLFYDLLFDTYKKDLNVEQFSCNKTYDEGHFK